jgi:Lar family restriction alleviation protein
MLDLKPCPFCGGEAFLREFKDRGFERALVCCTVCISATPHYRESKKAVELWNRRAALKEIGGSDA